MSNMGDAAYLVYVIQYVPMSVMLISWMEILRAAGVLISYEGTISYIYDDKGEPQLLSKGAVWGGFFFVLVLTQLIVWPLSFYLRKLPVMNKMF